MTKDCSRVYHGSYGRKELVGGHVIGVVVGNDVVGGIGEYVVGGKLNNSQGWL